MLEGRDGNWANSKGDKRINIATNTNFILHMLLLDREIFLQYILFLRITYF